MLTPDVILSDTGAIFSSSSFPWLLQLAGMQSIRSPVLQYYMLFRMEDVLNGLVLSSSARRWIICALGITWIHRLDTFLWIPPFVVWCVAAGTRASHFTGGGIRSPTGANGAASALSFMAVVFSFAVSWVNCAADYNVRMPVNTPQHKIFGATYIGIAVPAILVQSLGAALYSGTFVDKAWKAAYHEVGVDGPLKLALEPTGGFGRFLLVLAALSSIPVSLHQLSLQLMRR